MRPQREFERISVGAPGFPSWMPCVLLDVAHTELSRRWLEGGGATRPCSVTNRPEVNLAGHLMRKGCLEEWDWFSFPGD